MFIYIDALHNLFKMGAKKNNPAKCEVRAEIQFLMEKNNTPDDFGDIYGQDMSYSTIRQ